MFKYEKIQELTGMSGAAVPAPDYLFEVVYCDQMNTKFAETKGQRDLIYAFHGSRLENFHSILHHGLHCHLNRVRLLAFALSSAGYLQLMTLLKNRPKFL